MKLKMRSKKFWFWFLGFLVTIFILGEIALRYFLGFCHAPLYQTSELYEYIPKPNQKGQRFGNHYAFNSFSQRNEEPNPKKKKILGLGDSVIHGGAPTDQDSLATSIFSNKNKAYQMLNISAGSWGPDNCMAYLKEQGTFDAVGIFLVVSSHDAYDNMAFDAVVGMHESYPAEQYALAWGELFGRYVLPKFNGYTAPNKAADPDQKVLDGIGIQKKAKSFNTGFDDLKHLADSLKIPFVVYLHPDQAELQQKQYNAQGQTIIDWASTRGVEFIKGLEEGFTETDYRDGIHLNESGQRKLGMVMGDKITS